METPQRPLLQKQQQGQQQPPTTYARERLNRALWNCVALGTFGRAGRHLDHEQLGWLASRAAEYDGDTEATAAYLSDMLRRHQIVAYGQLVGVPLTDERQRLQRLARFVEAVRHGDA